MQPDHLDPAVVDFGVLADWMDDRALPGGPFEDVERLGGGTQNVLLRFRRGGREYVLRRPPVHLRPRSNDALRREARVLAALGETPVRAPRLIAACADETVMGGAVFYLGNLLFSCEGPEVAAIVDWEMCTIGDPLLDLGWLVATWPDEKTAMSAGPIGELGGLPGTGELVEVYAARSDRDLSGLTWYAVLACFKLGIVLEGTYARACAGKAPRDVGDLLHATTLGLFARARTFMEA